MPKKGLTNPLNNSLLIVGATDKDSPALTQLDEAMAIRDHKAIAKLLNGFRLPWIELYSSRYSYDKTVGSDPQQAALIKTNCSRTQLAEVRQAKTHYIVYNQSRRKRVVT